MYGGWPVESEKGLQRESKWAYDGRATLLSPLSTTEKLVERVGHAVDAAPVGGGEKYWLLFNFIFNLRLYLIKKYHETRYICIYTSYWTNVVNCRCAILSYPRYDCHDEARMLRSVD